MGEAVEAAHAADDIPVARVAGRGLVVDALRDDVPHHEARVVLRTGAVASLSSTSLFPAGSNSTTTPSREWGPLSMSAGRRVL